MHKADLKHNDASLQQKLEAIFRLRHAKSVINWDRGQYLELLKDFGNPHKNLPRVIHVAGTNGKGSIIAILRSILEAQGLRVHCYTSPHLNHVNERIYLAGADIDDGYLEVLIDQVLEHVDGAPLSFFEIITALAFKAFSDVPADILLLEVGMGGRLDCTNVIDAPIATIINRISMDHTEFLGDDICQIAAEKAGIMKAGVPCVIGAQGDDAVVEVLLGAAQDAGVIELDWSIVQQNDRMVFSYNGQSYEFPVPALLGAHQVQNAGMAIAALFSVRDEIDVSDSAIIQGLQSVQWRGRLQKLSYLDVGGEVWLDCGHNDSAGEALALQMKVWRLEDDRPLHLVVGMLDVKDSAGFLTPLLPYVTSLHVVPISSDPNSQGIGQINVDISQIYEHDNFMDALEHISSKASSARILIAGSVYLAGEVLGYKK